MENHEEGIREYCLEIKVKSHPNQNCKTFHCRQKLLGYGKYAKYVADLDETYNNKKLPVLTQAIIDNLRETIGVKRVTCWPYEVNIEKATAYTWEEIDAKIRKIFATYLPI